jgi:hypothetical protein
VLSVSFGGAHGLAERDGTNVARPYFIDYINSDDPNRSHG